MIDPLPLLQELWKSMEYTILESDVKEQKIHRKQYGYVEGQGFTWRGGTYNYDASIKLQNTKTNTITEGRYSIHFQLEKSTKAAKKAMWGAICNAVGDQISAMKNEDQ